MKRALVTGGAGLIGSHVTDLLAREGWQVCVLDNLEPNSHRRGKPAWINPEAEFIARRLAGSRRHYGRARQHRDCLSPGCVRRVHAGDREICTR